MSKHLELRDVSVSFNGFMAVNGLNLSIDRGELRCLIGPNGAGKTTALDLICGKTRPTSGSIRFKDSEISNLSDYQIARSGVGRKFQVPSVFRQLTVRENLEVGYCKHNGVLTNLMRSGRSSEADGLDKIGRAHV